MTGYIRTNQKESLVGYYIGSNQIHDTREEAEKMLEPGQRVAECYLEFDEEDSVPCVMEKTINLVVDDLAEQMKDG